jgi:agmatinase
MFNRPDRNTPDRMDLPFVGLTTFARQPSCPDWNALDGADVAILGIPIDTASSYRVGTRFGPRAIREASMFHGFGPEGVFDFEDEVTYLTADEVKIVDAGDSDVIYVVTKRSLANAEQAVRALLDAKTMPYISAAITRSPWQPSPPIRTRKPSTLPILMPISISSTNATELPGTTAVRCADRRKWRM